MIDTCIVGTWEIAFDSAEPIKRPKRYLLKDPTKRNQIHHFQQHANQVLNYSTSQHSDKADILHQLQSVKLISVPHEVTLMVILEHQHIPRSMISKMRLLHLMMVSNFK